jgi:hypothetical protein
MADNTRFDQASRDFLRTMEAEAPHNPNRQAFERKKLSPSDIPNMHWHREGLASHREVLRGVGLLGDAVIDEPKEIDADFRAKALEVAARHDVAMGELIREHQQLREAFPGPECEDCSCEMSLENHGNQDFYVCECYAHAGCSCHLGHAPCPWCTHIIIADDWMLEHSSEYRSEKRAEKNQMDFQEDIYEENKRLTAARACEQGPSAVAAAKPVTKLIITCQGDWSPWEENL